MTTQEYVDTTSHEVATSLENINDLFDEAGRKIGEGLHRDLWQRAVANIDDVTEIRVVKLEVAVLLSDPTVVEAVEDVARTRVDQWRSRYVDEIDHLPEKRHTVYADIAGTADQPSPIAIRYPDRVAWKRPRGASRWDKHIYIDDAGTFADDFNQLETEVLNAEIPNCVGWLRNPDRKAWSLTIPYQRRPGEYKPVYPDFLFFRQEADRIVIDILDPHGAHLPDAVSKAKGLALYAKDHGHRFGRIEILDRIDGRLHRLNLKDHKTRDQINTITNNDSLTVFYKMNSR